jgi:hypothetical protein
MLVCDTVIYIFLAWYIDNTTSHGAKESWHFFCKASYWGKRGTTPNTPDEDEESMEEFTQNVQNFEQVDGLGDPVIKINKLRKEFDIKGQTFVAVEGFKIELYENQLVSLLGKQRIFDEKQALKVRS